jgi:hypothetical protein
MTRLFRHYTSVLEYSSVTKDIKYTNNGLFTATPSRSKKIVKASMMFIETGRFERVPSQEGVARTVFGPWFRHMGIVYGKDLSTRLQSLYRLTNARGGDLAQDTMCRQAQEACDFTSYPVFIDLKRRIELALHPVTDVYCAIVDNANEVHPKRALRLAALEELTEKGLVYGTAYTTLVTSKLKPLEWAKFGKAPRNIVDMSCPASLLGGYLMATLKHCMEKPYVDDKLWAAYVPNPNVQRITALFERLINPEQVTFGYFSDDSCASFKCSDGVLMVNLDISGCDGSHTRTVFETMSWLCEGTKHSATMAGVLDQLSLPLEFRHDDVKLSLTPLGRALYSGSTATTFTNNVGVVSIGHRLSEVYSPDLTMDQMYARIIPACASVGYMMTCQRCECVEDLQFLKMSPCYLTDGSLSSCLNLGVILRTIGQCAGELPGRKKIPEHKRVWDYTCGLVAGFKHAGNHSLLSILRRKYPDRCTPIYSGYLTSHMSGTTGTADDFSICRRYRITPDEWSELLDLVESASFGDILWCPASEKILDLDYGLVSRA